MSLFRTQLAALALVAVAGSAAAAPLSINTTGVNLSALNASGETVALDLSTVGKFALGGLESALGGQVTDGTVGYNYEQSYTVTARSGYRIVGYELSGNADGLLSPGSLPQETTPGLAYSFSQLTLFASELGVMQPVNSAGFTNLSGSDSFLLEKTGLSVLDGLLLSISGTTQLGANPAVFDAGPGHDAFDELSPSTAAFNLNGVFLYVYTEALSSDVPEPAGVAVFGLGMGMMGLMRRRAAKK